MNRSDGEIDRLLARGGLGGAGREQILAQVLDAVPAPRRQPHRWGVWLGAFTLVASAATALVLVARPQEPAFRAKGAAAAVPVLDVGCAPASLPACPAGSTLVFSVLGAAAPGYLQGWAEPIGGGGQRIWYFSADTEAPAVPAGAGTQPARRGITIGPEHGPGQYLIHVVFSAAPLSRASLLAGGDAVLAHAIFPLTVLP